MRAPRFSTKPSLLAPALLAFCIMSSSAVALAACDRPVARLDCAQINASAATRIEVADNGHEALVKHYENLAKEAEARLQENMTMLKKYEAHPYYYGRQAEDIRSHAFANAREYEKILKENLNNADLHRKIAQEQSHRVNRVKINLNQILLR